MSIQNVCGSQAAVVAENAEQKATEKRAKTAIAFAIEGYTDIDTAKFRNAIVSFAMTSFRDASDKQTFLTNALANMAEHGSCVGFLSANGMMPDAKYKPVQATEGLTVEAIADMWTAKGKTKEATAPIALTETQTMKADALARAESVVTERAEEFRASFDVGTLNSMKSAQLREIAKNAKLKGRSGLKKDELVVLITTGTVPAPEANSTRWFKAEGQRLKKAGFIVGAVSGLNGETLRKVVAIAQSGKTVNLTVVKTVSFTVAD